MKQNIHPTWHSLTATCVCGNTFETGSTQGSINVDICAACHPFFTNEMRFVDRQGRVDRFMKQMSRAQGSTATKKGKKSKAQKAETQSFRDILEQQKQPETQTESK